MKQSLEYTLEDLLENIKEQFPESDEAFIYQSYNERLDRLGHPEYYIGSTSIKDRSYVGSGIEITNLIKGKHPTIPGTFPRDEWERKILTYCSKEDRYKVEQLFLTFYDAANNPHFLNRTNVAEGFGTGENHRSYTHGILVGRPKDEEGRKRWAKELPPERQRRYKEYEAKRQNKKNKKWREKNKERLREYRNSEKCKEYQKAYRERGRTIKRIIQMDDTYTKEYFKRMSLEEVQKIEEDVNSALERLSDIYRILPNVTNIILNI